MTPPRASWQLTLRIPASLGYSIMLAHNRRNMKRVPWIMEALREKCEREESEQTQKTDKPQPNHEDNHTYRSNRDGNEGAA